MIIFRARFVWHTEMGRYGLANEIYLRKQMSEGINTVILVHL